MALFYEKAISQNKKFLHDTFFLLSSYFHTRPITLLLEILGWGGCMGCPPTSNFWGDRPPGPLTSPPCMLCSYLLCFPLLSSASLYSALLISALLFSVLFCFFQLCSYLLCSLLLRSALFALLNYCLRLGFLKDDIQETETDLHTFLSVHKHIYMGYTCENMCVTRLSPVLWTIQRMAAIRGE